MTRTNTPSFLGAVTGSNRITVGTLLQLVWTRRWVFVVTFIATVAAVVVWALVATPMYRAAVAVMPRQGEEVGAGLQSLLSQFGGMASLAGMSVGASLDEQEAIAWLRSRALTGRFIEQRQLLPVLFDSMWDDDRQDWRDDLVRKPTMDDAWQVFDRRIRRVAQDGRTRLVTIEIIWKDRQQAAAWANELVAQANEELRMRALAEADASLASLAQQLEQIDVIGLRQSIYSLMETQLNRKVLANSRPDYAFAIIDPAVVPDENRIVSPRRRLMVLISLPFAVFVASCAAIGLQLASEASLRWRRRESP